MAKYRSYKFTDKHHSVGGIRSSIAGGISLLCCLCAVYCSYTAKGNAGKYLVVLGVTSLIGCCYGLYTGKKSFQEEECYYLFSRIGIVINLLLVFFWIAVAGVGYFLV